MTTAFIKHRVRDYDTWRKEYDAFAEFQEQHGVTEAAVYRTAGDPDELLVMHRFASPEAAQEFLSHEELKSKMAEAGVEGQPEVVLYDEA